MHRLLNGDYKVIFGRSRVWKSLHWNYGHVMKLNTLSAFNSQFYLCQLLSTRSLVEYMRTSESQVILIGILWSIFLHVIDIADQMSFNVLHGIQLVVCIVLSVLQQLHNPCKRLNLTHFYKRLSHHLAPCHRYTRTQSWYLSQTALA